MEYSGIWHIYEMEAWEEDYFNIEVQAHIKVNSNGLGKFQFGLVSGHIDGEIVKDDRDKRFEFTWEGNDECDAAFGSGWLRLKDGNNIKGRIKLHLGDGSNFLAKRVE